MAVCYGMKSRGQTVAGTSVKFGAGVDVYLGSVLSQLLFIMLMDKGN